MPYNPNKGGQFATNGAVSQATKAVTPATNGTIDDVTAAHSQAILNKNFAELQNQIDAILTALRNANLII
jgi:hypothetical protein